VTALDPAQGRDAFQRPRRGGQPRHERPDQRPARETAVSRRPSAVRRELNTSRANAGSARVQSQWSRSHLKASRLSPRYWSFIGATIPQAAVSRQLSAAPGALCRGDAALTGRKARCARGARLRAGAPATRALGGRHLVTH
jgi:hypothetical protein